MLGMHGTYEANMAMHEIDVLVAIGARFDDRVTVARSRTSVRNAKIIIHIDVDRASTSKKCASTYHRSSARSRACWRHAARDRDHPQVRMANAIQGWWTSINGWRTPDCLRYEQGQRARSNQYAVETMYKVTKDDDATFTSDVGQHQMSRRPAPSTCSTKPRR